MRRLLVLVTLLALLAAPGAHAAERADVRAFLGTQTEWVGLEAGRGLAGFARNQGVVIGRVADGSIRVVARIGRKPTIPSNCSRLRRPSAQVVVCYGKSIAITTSVDARVVFRGSGVNASAAIRGTLRLKGTRGRYQIGGSEWKRWPRVLRSFRVGS